MTSLLRQIVAGPRAKHAETGLDLCYVTSNIIATSGPSQTYPQRAYRNPLDRLVAFLDAKHGDGWAIWEFRAEGTGYPDEAVYGRIRHYPWPDHHPPPFRLVPMIMASMKQWLNGDEARDGTEAGSDSASQSQDAQIRSRRASRANKDDKGQNDRVIVVHCKAGKGRSGTMACSYLISECGWTAEDALARFTARRMRPNFGNGVSIPSQLRWVSYVDRWNKGGKKYVDREVEIVEVHVWGLRHGVKVSVEGFVDEGKKIRPFHTFTREERIVVEGDAPGGSGVVDLVSDMAGHGLGSPSGEQDPDYSDVVDGADAGQEVSKSTGKDDTDSTKPSRGASKKIKGAKTTFAKRLSPKVSSSQGLDNLGSNANGRGRTILMPNPSTDSSTTSLGVNGTVNSKPQAQSVPSLQHAPTWASSSEPGGLAVIFKPSGPIRIPNSDVNIAVERRNRAPASMGLTMVTAVAHVWFNTYFEGGGPEKDGKSDSSGVFEIDWNKMDGIKGSSQKGTRACDRLSVVWRVAGTESPEQDEAATHVAPVKTPETMTEPGKDSPVPQMRPADWKGENNEDPEKEKGLGLRKESPDSAGASKASSIMDDDDGGGDKSSGNEVKDDDLVGVKASGPSGEEMLDSAESPAKTSH